MRAGSRVQMVNSKRRSKEVTDIHPILIQNIVVDGVPFALLPAKIAVRPTQAC